MGQKNCSLKSEDDLNQIIGKYRVTSEWLGFKPGINNRIKSFKDENSNSFVSLENKCKKACDNNKIEEKSIVSRYPANHHIRANMNVDKKPDSSTSARDSDNHLLGELLESDEVSSTSQYEIVEETEALETDSITESIDIRISPRNSTVELMTFQCAEDFPTEFSYVADVEVKMNEDQECVVSTTQSPAVKDLLTGDESSTMEVKVFEVRSKETFRDAPSSKKQAKTDLDSMHCENYDLSEHTLETSGPGTSVSRKCALTGTRKETKRSGSISSFSVESKIAQEIKEMKQREEEIRKMRENMAKENCRKPAIIQPMNLSKSESVKPAQETVKKEITKKFPSKNKMVTDGQSYNIASVFAPKRKDSSPIESSTPSSTYESPIEREIRIVREREEELKRERELALKMKYQLESCQSNVDFSEDEKDTTLDTLTSVSICSDSSFDSGTKLTSPHQRNYAESMSPTSFHNKLNVMYSNSSNMGSACSLDSISQSDLNGLQKLTSSKDSLLSLRSPSPDSSSSSSISKLSLPFTGQKTSPNIPNVNMERFIASKGKDISFKSPGSRISVGSSDYFEIKPPQIKKGEQMTQRKFLSAASKIQCELQEMKEREDELRKVREHMINMNESNTPPVPGNSVENSISTKDVCTSSDEPTKGKEVQSERENEDLSPTRRKSSLIEEWERRIQNFRVQV